MESIAYQVVGGLLVLLIVLVYRQNRLLSATLANTLAINARLSALVELFHAVAMTDHEEFEKRERAFHDGLLARARERLGLRI